MEEREEGPISMPKRWIANPGYVCCIVAPQEGDLPIVQLLALVTVTARSLWEPAPKDFGV